MANHSDKLTQAQQNWIHNRKPRCYNTKITQFWPPCMTCTQPVTRGNRKVIEVQSQLCQHPADKQTLWKQAFMHKIMDK